MLYKAQTDHNIDKRHEVLLNCLKKTYDKKVYYTYHKTSHINFC